MNKGLEALERIKKMLKGYETSVEPLEIVENELKTLENYRHKDFETEIKVKKQDEILRVIKEYIYIEKDEYGLCWLSTIANGSIGIPEKEYNLLKEYFNE